MPATDVLSRQRQLETALRRLGPAGLRRFQRDLRASARRNALTYVLDDGRTVIMPLLAAPALLPASDARYLHRMVLAFLAAFRRTVVARRSDPAVRALLPLDADEEDWLALAPAKMGPLIGRFDINVDPRRGGAAAATLLELNGCAVGGIHYGPATSRTLLEHVGPLAGRAPHMPDAMSEVWIDLCRGHARAMGRTGLRVIWLEDRDWDAGITEGPTLVEELRAAGHGADQADPRDLSLRRGDLWVGGRRVDVAYRGMDVRDLLAIEAEDGRPLRAMREAVRMGRVLSPMEGDLDHKSLLEVWSSPRFAALFDRPTRAMLRKHVPWTRMIGGRVTEDPAGHRVDLPEFVDRHRARLVIKPNRACGGEGILIGAATTPSRWRKAIDQALSGAAPAVAQQFIRGARVRSPVVRNGRVVVEDHFTNFGLMASPRRMGILGRAAPFPVVNVSRGGGVLGVLLV